MRRALVILLTALLLATAVPADAATPQRKYENTAHQSTNRVRTTHDLATLRKSACLRKWARSWAAQLAKRGEIQSDPHQPAGPVMRDCKLTSYGENVAAGFSSGRAAVKQGWMNSPPHRENLLRRGYRLMGIGAVKADGVWYVAQVFGRK